MSKCWKCNKEFYSENLIRTLCDECLGKIPKTTATTDFGNLLNSEIKDLVDDFSKRKISELEAKLEEHNEYFRSFSCENFNEFQDFISTFMLTPHEEQTLIRELKQQLAEKENRIKKLNLEAQKYYEDAYCNDFHNQDKISFALEQLEKVKNIILNERKITSFKFDTFNKGKDTALFWLNEQIDQQINELKGEK